MEESIRASGSAEVEAHDVGLAILPPLRRLDVVAYLRFASVYQAFEDLEDFERAIDVLRDQQAELAGQQTLVPPASRPPATPARRRPARKGAQDPANAVGRGAADERASDGSALDGGTPTDGASDRGVAEDGSAEQTGTHEDSRSRSSDQAGRGSGEKPAAARRRRAKKPADTVTQPRLL